VLVDRQTHDKAVRMSKERVRRGGKDYPNAPLQPERVISTVPKIVLNAYVFFAIIWPFFVLFYLIEFYTVLFIFVSSPVRTSLCGMT
jgi:hypothetical protein